MTKRVNLLPSERIDVPDMVAATTSVAVGTMQQILDDLVIAKFPRVSSGFRTEIANQGTSPGEVTVWNGLAIDRSGQLFTNEDEENTQRSITFGADGTYFLEVAFTVTPSDSDARAFWDPTFDNGTDPSGDPRLPGREVFQTVATRLSPDWQIVNPVSTSGFDITTNPDSLRIPVAVITVAGGVVTGATTFPARSCLAQTANIGASKLYVLDSRLMPDSFTATVDAETVAVASNDRTNGILTLSGPLAVQHLSGARVVRTGGGLNQFLQNRAAPALPTSGTADARPGLFQGNENRGYALAQNPESASGRGDPQLQALKDQIDFMAAQMREIRFGAERDGDLGALTPPSSFASPRYYDRSGGLQGARYATISIGDGVTTWGDLNVAQMGSADAALAAAVAALPAAGGTIYIKGSSSPYDFTTGVSISGRTVYLVGEPGRTTLRATAAAAVLQLTNCTLGLRDIHIARQSTATAVSAITTTTGGAMTTYDAYNSIIDGISGTAYCKGLFQNCTLQEVAGGSSNGYALSSRIVDCSFISCTFTSATNAVGTRCVNVQALGSKNIAFYSCHFNAAGATQAAMIETSASNDSGGLLMDSCIFTGAATTTVQDAVLVSATGNSFANIRLRSCRSSGLGIGGLLNGDGLDGCLVQDSTMTIGSTGGYGVKVGSDANNKRVSVVGCKFDHAAASSTTTYGVLVNNCTELVVDRCVFSDCAYAIDLTTVTTANITNCSASAPDAGCGRAFLWVVTSATNLSVSGCKVQGLSDATDTHITGVKFGMNCTNVDINGCTFRNLGTSSSAVIVAGVAIADDASVGRNISIRGCKFSNVAAQNAAGFAYGVDVRASSDVLPNLDISDNQFYSIGATASVSAAIHATNLSGTVSKNTATSIGNTGRAGYFLITTAITVDLVVSGNTAVTLYGDGSVGGGVVLSKLVTDVTVVNNVFDMSGTYNAAYGISANGAGDTNSAITGLTIIGNIIGSNVTNSLPIGIFVNMTNNAVALDQGRCTIKGNTIRGYTLVGVQVTASGANPGYGITVDNNLLETNYGSIPIWSLLFTNLANLSVLGNTVNMFDSTQNAKRGIAITTCESVTVASNNLFVGGCSMDGFITFDNCTSCSLTSNLIYVANPSVAFIGVKLVNFVTAQVWAVGNNVRAGAIAGASYNVVGGTGLYQVCFNAQNANSGVAPVGLAAVDPNWWQL